MARSQWQTPVSSSTLLPWPTRQGWAARLLSWSGGIAAVTIGWRWGARNPVALALAAAGLTLALTRLLEDASWARRWRYRGAVGLAWLGSGLVSGLGAALRPEAGWLAVVVAAAVGTLIGGWFASARRGGWCENNHPPSAEVQARVRAAHADMRPRAAGLDAKRLFDFILAGLGLILGAPVFLLIGALIWLEDPGPVLFVKNSVGLGGVSFRQFKFRTMIRDAEEESGPVLAAVGDRRVLRVGRVLRKTALDELPQLLNILLGQMSFVGPRPQRTVLVDAYLQDLPAYAARHQVRPGLAGLAQVAGSYYLTPARKLSFDRLYIRHSSLGFDLRLLFLAFSLTFWFRWQPAARGRLPRRWLHRRGTRSAPV